MNSYYNKYSKYKLKYSELKNNHLAMTSVYSLTGGAPSDINELLGQQQKLIVELDQTIDHTNSKVRDLIKQLQTIHEQINTSMEQKSTQQSNVAAQQQVSAAVSGMQDIERDAAQVQPTQKPSTRPAPNAYFTVSDSARRQFGNKLDPESIKNMFSQSVKDKFNIQYIQNPKDVVNYSGKFLVIFDAFESRGGRVQPDARVDAILGTEKIKIENTDITLSPMDYIIHKFNGNVIWFFVHPNDISNDFIEQARSATSNNSKYPSGFKLNSRKEDEKIQVSHHTKLSEIGNKMELLSTGINKVIS